jgi:hypothetical protein
VSPLIHLVAIVTIVYGIVVALLPPVWLALHTFRRRLAGDNGAWKYASKLPILLEVRKGICNCTPSGERPWVLYVPAECGFRPRLVVTSRRENCPSRDSDKLLFLRHLWLGFGLEPADVIDATEMLDPDVGRVAIITTITAVPV